MREAGAAAAAATVDAWPTHEDAVILSPGDDFDGLNWASVGTVDALCLGNGFLPASGAQNAYISLRFNLGPQGSVHEWVILHRTGPDHGQLTGFLASLAENDPASGAADPSNILQDISTASFVRVFKIEGYSAALARNVEVEAGAARDGIDNLFNSGAFRVMGAPGTPFTAVALEPVTGLFTINGGPGPYALMLKVEDKLGGSSTGYKFDLQALHHKRVDWAFG